MRKNWLCAALILVLGGAVMSGASENLVVNPGFEAGPSSSGLPESWSLQQTKGDTEAKLDSSIRRTGAASARLHAAIPSRCVLASAPFLVSPGDELRFEAWARGADLPTNGASISAGIAFRNPDGRIIQRDYFRVDITNNEWRRISGVAHAPNEPATAEAHLGYANAPGTVWFDDVEAEVTSPVSLALVHDANPWAGRQEITVRVTNRQTNDLQGTVWCTIGKEVAHVQADVPPEKSEDLKIPIALNGAGTHRYKLELFNATNASLRVIRGEFTTERSLTLFPACPCYQNAGEGDGSTRVDARVNLAPEKRRGLKLAFELSDSDGKPLQTITVDADEGRFVGCDLKVPIAHPATFFVTASLRDGSGKQVATDKTRVRIVEKGESVVTLGADGFLRIGGKPHFPIGLYSCGNFDEMKKADFTAGHEYPLVNGAAEETINPNDGHVLELLDDAAAHGMRVQIELPRKAVEQGRLEQVRRRIETFKHHPGLLCWDSEERIARETTSPENIARLYRLVHETDPDHPFVLGDSRAPSRLMEGAGGNFFPEADMDIGIWWWYPFPLHEPAGDELKEDNLLQPPAWLARTTCKKPLWIAVQAYQQPWKKSRFPTPAEYRCQSYLSIINGVKGLWFYTGYGERDYLGKPAGLLNKPIESHWDYVQKLVRELREFSPIILSPRATEEITLSPTNAFVEFATRESNGKIYLIAANKAPQKQTVRFTGPGLKGRQARVLYEEHAARVDGSQLDDEFPPFAVHVYELSAGQ